MSIRIVAATSALLLASPASAASWNIDGRWLVVEAQPPLPEARGHNGTLRISANQPHPEAREYAGLQDGHYDLSMSGACNGVSGTLEIAGGAPDFQAQASTAQVCPDERGDFERPTVRLCMTACDQPCMWCPSRPFLLGLAPHD